MSETTVFIVDDDPAVRDSLKFLVESGGYEVECFDTARVFLDRARQPIHGCLVADLRLPGMSGLEMHERLRQRGVVLPTIMISGHGDVPVAVRAMKAGVIDFLQKPFADQVLFDLIGQALRDGEQRREAERGLGGAARTLRPVEPAGARGDGGRGRRAAKQTDRRRPRPVAQDHRGAPLPTSWRRWGPRRWPSWCGWTWRSGPSSSRPEAQT